MLDIVSTISINQNEINNILGLNFDTSEQILYFVKKSLNYLL